MNALHASRQAFIESESSERIRKALRKKICTNNRIFKHGEKVWYKRERGNGRWRGPAKVIFQDGKVVWLRHGSTAIRVSVNRIVKQGEEFGKHVERTAREIDSKEVVNETPVVNVDETIVPEQEESDTIIQVQQDFLDLLM